MSKQWQLQQAKSQFSQLGKTRVRSCNPAKYMEKGHKGGKFLQSESMNIYNTCPSGDRPVLFRSVPELSPRN